VLTNGQLAGQLENIIPPLRIAAKAGKLIWQQVQLCDKATISSRNNK